MDEYRYLLVLAACAAAALPLEWVLRARVVRRPRRWIASLLPAAVVFVTVDALVIAAGQRRFTDHHLTGLALRGLVPVEELLLVLVVPTAALLVYEGVGTVLAWRRAEDGARSRESEPHRVGGGPDA